MKTKQRKFQEIIKPNTQYFPVMLEMERKIVLAFVFFSVFFLLFCLCCLFFGIRCVYFFSLCLSNGKAPSIKKIFVKFLLMLIFFTNFNQFFCNFVYSSVTGL